MKKFLATILCFVYVVASSGATINLHYCMGKFTGWDVAASAPATCDNCGMHKEQKKGCCKDKHATLQLKKDQLASTINEVPLNHFVYIQHTYIAFNKPFLFTDNDVTKSIHGLPLLQAVSPIILNCVFRI